MEILIYIVRIIAVILVVLGVAFVAGACYFIKEHNKYRS
jgi:hypothetical protein